LRIVVLLYTSDARTRYLVISLLTQDTNGASPQPDEHVRTWWLRLWT
jgi:hypothetical protein